MNSTKETNNMDTLQLQLIRIFGVNGWRQLEKDEHIKKGDYYSNCGDIVSTGAVGQLVGDWTTYYRAKPKAETTDEASDDLWLVYRRDQPVSQYTDYNVAVGEAKRQAARDNAKVTVFKAVGVASPPQEISYEEFT